jgi:hypothetical protein
MAVSQPSGFGHCRRSLGDRASSMRILSVYVGVRWGSGSFQVGVRLGSRPMSEEVHDDEANPVQATLASVG